MLDGSDEEGRGFTRHWNLTQYSIYSGINFDGVQFPFIIPGYCQPCRLIRHRQTQAKCIPCPCHSLRATGVHPLRTAPCLAPSTHGPSKGHPSTGGSVGLWAWPAAPSPPLPNGSSSLPLHGSVFGDDGEGWKRCNISLLTLSSHEFRILFSKGLII